MYAIVESGGKQYQVEKDAVIRVEKIAAEPGSEVVFDKVLMTGGDSCHVGTPYLKDVLVKGQVVAQGRGPKVLLAKVNALLRRFSPASAGAITAGKIMLHPNAHKVYLDGREIALTHKEYELLSFLMANPDRYSAGNSFSAVSGAMILRERPAPWTPTSRPCGKSWGTRAGISSR